MLETLMQFIDVLYFIFLACAIGAVAWAIWSWWTADAPT